jgi:hypothetical protein
MEHTNMNYFESDSIIITLKRVAGESLLCAHANERKLLNPRLKGFASSIDVMVTQYERPRV